MDIIPKSTHHGASHEAVQTRWLQAHLIIKRKTTHAPSCTRCTSYKVQGTDGARSEGFHFTWHLNHTRAAHKVYGLQTVHHKRRQGKRDYLIFDGNESRSLGKHERQATGSLHISLSFQFMGQATCGSGDYSMHIKYRLS